MARTNPPKATIRRLDSGQLRADVRGGRPGAALEVARKIASAARANAPRRTGKLKGKITAAPAGRRAAVVRSDATYSRYQDEGAPRAHVPATHFFTRAVRAQQ